MDEVQARYDRAFELLGTDFDALLIVPPLADLYRPALSVHLLQAVAEQAGFRVRILYANLLFAILSGEDLYNTAYYGHFGWLWGERLFSAAAFGLPPLGYRREEMRKQTASLKNGSDGEPLFEQLASLERQTAAFCADLGNRMASLRFRVAGATNTYHQTAAGCALLAQVKRVHPEVITAMGGANCEDEMAKGVASLGAPIDYVFSGECESAFPDFLRRIVAGQPLPAERIVRGEACRDLDTLPEPSFEDYFAQLDNALPNCLEDNNNEVWLPYESSRGCWWGARQHCTFCGLNDETMFFREKSPERVIGGAKRLLLRYPTRRIGMVDNILPHSYFRTVLPRLANELPPAQIFYEVKSNLNLEQVELMRRAGIVQIQPGIEALSSSLLRRMKKGVLARQNLALLRYARATGMGVAWNLLYGFPGDQREDYDSTLALIPLIHHLPPPNGAYLLSLDRFSPYFQDPAAYGITPLDPAPSYACAFPPSADLQSLAYQFTGKYPCAQSSNPELYGSLERAVREWRSSWKAGSPAPALTLTPGGDGYYSLMDTRDLEGSEMFQFLNEEEARTVLIGGPLDRQPLAEWAIERKLAVALDGWCAPLATTDVETWRRLEARKPQEALQTLPATV